MADLTNNEKEILVCALIEVWMRTDKIMISDIEPIADKLGLLPQLTERLHELNYRMKN